MIHPTRKSNRTRRKRHGLPALPFYGRTAGVISVRLPARFAANLEQPYTPLTVRTVPESRGYTV